MKKLQGFVDPISLTFLIVIGIAGAGTVIQHEKAEQQLAQDTQIEMETSAEAAHTYLAEN